MNDYGTCAYCGAAVEDGGPVCDPFCQSIRALEEAIAR